MCRTVSVANLYLDQQQRVDISGPHLCSICQELVPLPTLVDALSSTLVEIYTAVV